MTNLEAFKGILVGTFTDEQLKVYLINNGLDPNATYEKENAKALDFAKIDSLLLLVGVSQSVRELDYQITERSIADLKDLIGIIYDKWGVKNPLLKNKVKGVNRW